jgi:hypothetical protein
MTHPPLLDQLGVPREKPCPQCQNDGEGCSLCGGLGGFTLSLDERIEAMEKMYPHGAWRFTRHPEAGWNPSSRGLAASERDKDRIEQLSLPDLLASVRALAEGKADG